MTGTVLSPIRTTRPPRRWLRVSLIVVGFLVLIGVGAFLAFIPYAADNDALKTALKHVESGSIPDEPPDYVLQIEKDLKADPPAQIIPATYSSIDSYHDVTYNAVISLKPDGSYDYALTVGNSRVFKLYKHTGKWWVQGKVLNSILLKGDAFLTEPAARDRKTPSRERIIESSANEIVLQAHYGPQVHFKKVD